MTPPRLVDPLQLVMAIQQLSSVDGRPLRGESILVALSGGADSVVLLDILCQLRETLDLRIQAAHMDHGLRDNSHEDMEFCRDLCQQLDVPFHHTRTQIEGRARGGIEAAGRSARYSYLDELCRREDLDLVATGHHLDDQLETLLLWMFRGTGLSGMRGIVPRSDARLRPLRSFTREQIQAYARARGLKWREDPSNQSPRHLRNRLRHELLPQIDSIFGDGAGGRLVDSARRASGELQALESVSQTLLDEWVTGSDDGCFTLPRKDFVALPAPLQIHLFRRIMSQLQPKKTRQHWNESAYRRVLEFSEHGHAGKRLPLPGGGWLHLSRGRIDLQPKDWAAPVETFTLCAESLPAETGMLTFSGERSALFDADRVRFPLRLRPAEPGDRVRPHAGGGHRRLAELLREKGVPRWQRWSTLVVEDAAEIIWVVGGAVAADRQPSEHSERLLRLSLQTTERTLCS